MMRWAWVFGSFFVLACVSKTLFDARFADSRVIAAPTVQVSPPDPTKFTFAMVGDTHVGGTDTTRLRRILADAAGEGDAFVVLLGDIVDQGRAEDVEAVYQAIVDAGFLDKFLPVIGNHDIFEAGWDSYQSRFGASHYSVDIGNSRFLALDTADGIIGEDQSEWLESELKKPQPENTFILSHYLPVVPGQRTYLRLSNQSEAEKLMKLASSHGVKGWFGAHYHSFIRETIDGVTYIVAGGGGGRRMQPVLSHFFVQVSVNGSEINFRLREVP